MLKVGIPRALFYYEYYPLWEAFFHELGAVVILSPPTGKRILDAGVRAAVDEACLPVKVFYGHVLDLVGQVDYLFLPRFISVAAGTYVCPKFLGLPDMIRAGVPGLPPLLEPVINLRQGQLFTAFKEMGQTLGAGRGQISRAYRVACQRLELYEKHRLRGILPEAAQLRVALLGHSYNLYDNYTNMNLIRKLADLQVAVITPDNLEPELIARAVGTLPKKVFWSMGSKIIGAALYFLQEQNVDGIIHVAAFGCGPDSLTGELIERMVRRQKRLPILNLTIDEHTGEAGLQTRLEAFCDMLYRRKTNESYLPTHG